MNRGFAVAYGLIAYLAFLGAFAVLADFVANTGFVRGIDSETCDSTAIAVVTDLALIGLFGVSHSVMARPAFKERWTRIVPEVVERSTYVLVASAILLLNVWQWRALPGSIWIVEQPILRALIWALSGAGIVLIVLSTFLTDHFDLFGLRQVWLHARGRPYTPTPFQLRGLYKYVRHPMMLGVVIWLWATPSMSVGHLIFAAGMTTYVLVGIAFEERDLATALGQPYREYRDRVRALLPIRR